MERTSKRRFRFPWALLYDCDAYSVHKDSFVTGLSEHDAGMFMFYGVSFYKSYLPMFSKKKRLRMENSGEEHQMSDLEREVERRIRAESLIDSIHDDARRQTARLEEDRRQRLWASSESGNQHIGRRNNDSDSPRISKATAYDIQSSSGEREGEG